MPYDERYKIETSFKNRFGFSLQAYLCLLVIKLKEQFKLTDSEITLFKRCGALLANIIADDLQTISV
jgi:hypothetical protein